MSRRITSPTIWVAIEKIVQQGIWTLLFFLLARILGPKVYGQFAIVMVFIQLFELLVLEATIEALIGAQPLHTKHLMTANIVALAVAGAMGLVLFSCASFLSESFGDPDLQPVFVALSVLPVMSALTASPTAVLRSELRFKVLTIRSTVAITCGGACGLLLALNGGGIWALVAQTIAQRVVEIVILLSNTRRFRIGFSRRHFEQLRLFAGAVSFSRGLVFITGLSPRVVLGLVLGPFAVGLYALAARITDALAVLTLVPTTTVARSTLRQYAGSRNELEEAFRKLLRDTALIAFPACAGAAAIIPLFITGALDERWAPSIFPAQALVIAPMAWLINYASTALLLATGHPQAEAKMSLAQALSTFIVLFAVPLGVDVLCLVSTIRYIALVPVALFIVSRRCGIGPGVFLDALAAPLAFSVFMGFVVALASDFLAPTLPPLAALALLVALGVICYGLLIAVSERTRALELMRKLRGTESVST